MLHFHFKCIATTKNTENKDKKSQLSHDRDKERDKKAKKSINNTK